MSNFAAKVADTYTITSYNSQALVTCHQCIIRSNMSITYPVGLDKRTEILC